MDIHVLTCYGSSIQGNLNFNQKINKSNQFEVHYEYPTPLSIRKQNERNLSVQIWLVVIPWSDQQNLSDRRANLTQLFAVRFHTRSGAQCGTTTRRTPTNL